ncbi:hypothetical protein GF336_01130 [Candidatus Woesearchaeota archaeon]|nr:hypothetical protein [Candidatus Woesearchaeota archaeon]
MNKKIIMMLFVSFFLLNLASTSVNAQEDDGILDTLLEPLGDLNLAETYENSPHVVDGIIFSIIFITIAVIGLGRVMPGRAGKTLAIVVGIAFAVAFEVWSYNRDPPFTLQSFGPAAVLILIVALGIALQRLASNIPGLGGTNAGLISIVVSWYTFKSLSPGTYAWLTVKGGLWQLIVALADVAALIIVIKLMINAFKAIFGALREGEGKGTIGSTISQEVKDASEAVQTGADEVNKFKDKWGKRKDKKLHRALRRVWKFNKKLKNDIDAALSLFRENRFEEAKQKVEEAKQYENKEIDYEAMINDLTNDLASVSEASIKQKITSLNNSIKMNLNKIKEQVNKFNKTPKAITLWPAKRAAEDIEKEILGLEVLEKEALEE